MAAGHSIKVIMSLLMVEVVQPRFRPDEARFGVAASITSTLHIVCGARNIAFRV